jgi:small subunit ribosomal protein S20
LDAEPGSRSGRSSWGPDRALIPFTSRYRCNEVSVANIKSQKKRILTNAKAAERNKAVKSELKTRLKNARTTIGTPENTEAVRLAVKRIDMAAAKGIIHPNTAARRKSRLMKKVNAAG